MNKGHAIISNMKNGKVFIKESFIHNSHQLIELFNLSHCEFKNLRCFLSICVRLLPIMSSWENRIVSFL